MYQRSDEYKLYLEEEQYYKWLAEISFRIQLPGLIWMFSGKRKQLLLPCLHYWFKLLIIRES